MYICTHTDKVPDPWLWINNCLGQWYWWVFRLYVWEYWDLHENSQKVWKNSIQHHWTCSKLVSTHASRHVQHMKKFWIVHGNFGLTFTSMPFAGDGSDDEDHLDTQTAYACQNGMLTLACREGFVIRIRRANYGRFTLNLCNPKGITTNMDLRCQSITSMDIVATEWVVKCCCITYHLHSFFSLFWIVFLFFLLFCFFMDTEGHFQGF